VKNATNASAQNREREDEREETMNDDRRAKSAWPTEQCLSTGDKTRRELIGAAALALALMPGAARSQERFPAKNIRIIVPFPAGATTDMLARLFAQRMSDGLNQAVVVENVGGAGGSLGADQVAKAAPDGYTLLFHNITFTTTTSSLQFVGRSRHDIEQDFVPIAVGAYVPLLLLAHPSVPARDLKEFVE
jgi:tripartite-type tricarboxylate transporter receptor subunit TctC